MRGDGKEKRVGGRGKKSLLLYAPYIKENPDERLCVMFPREGLVKHEILEFF